MQLLRAWNTAFKLFEIFILSTKKWPGWEFVPTWPKILQKRKEKKTKKKGPILGINSRLESGC